MEILSINEIANQLNPIFSKHNIKKATLFGSYAKGLAKPDSDVDLLVEMPNEVDAFTFFDLQHQMKETIGKEVELYASFELIPQAALDNEIKQTGVLIYEASGH